MMLTSRKWTRRRELHVDRASVCWIGNGKRLVQTTRAVAHSLLPLLEKEQKAPPHSKALENSCPHRRGRWMG